MDDLHQRLEQVFRDCFSDDSIELSDETTPSDIPAWDSLGHVNLMFAIESTFGVQFTGNQLAKFKNIGELKQFLCTAACNQ